MGLQLDSILLDPITTVQRDALVLPAHGLTIYNDDNDRLETNDGTPASPNWVGAGAQVSADASGVADAGAVMETDTTTALMQFVLDEDNMASDSATKLATQQSIKKYVDDAVTGAKAYQGGYDAATNTPDLDSSPIAGIVSGDMYDVTAAGTFFGAAVEIGDTLIANTDSPTLEAHWTIVQANLTPASIKTAYESNADTNAFTDADVTNLGNQSGTNTGDEVDATTTVKGIVEKSTSAENVGGTAADVYPDVAGVKEMIDTHSPGLVTKAGEALVGAFTGNPKVATVTLSTAFADTNYAIAITPIMTDGSKNFVVTAFDKLVGSFKISLNSNSTVDLISVAWTATKHGES